MGCFGLSTFLGSETKVCGFWLRPTRVCPASKCPVNALWNTKMFRFPKTLPCSWTPLISTKIKTFHKGSNLTFMLRLSYLRGLKSISGHLSCSSSGTNAGRCRTVLWWWIYRWITIIRVLLYFEHWSLVASVSDNSEKVSHR